MKKTTLIHKSADMRHEPLPECHAGKGVLDWTEVLGPDQLKGRRLKFMHYNIMPPGTSIGEHSHHDDEEYYFVISGQGTMILDGKRFEVKSGDITAIYPGGSHGLENNTTDDLRFLVICVS